MFSWIKKSTCKSHNDTVINEKQNPINKINDEIDELKNTDNKIQLFSLKNEFKYGFVVDVYDGDTCKINMKFKDKLYKWNCRLMGIDTPELRTKNNKEKECGYYVRDKLRENILKKIVVVQCLEFDKYGRLLVYLYQYDENKSLDSYKESTNTTDSINQWLINNNYALSYDGGTKTIQEWDINKLKK